MMKLTKNYLMYAQVEESLGESVEVALPLSDQESLTEVGGPEFRSLLPPASSDLQPPAPGRPKEPRFHSAELSPGLPGTDGQKLLFELCPFLYNYYYGYYALGPSVENSKNAYGIAIPNDPLLPPPIPISWL
jgi:hypothetical protein